MMKRRLKNISILCMLLLLLISCDRSSAESNGESDVITDSGTTPVTYAVESSPGEENTDGKEYKPVTKSMYMLEYDGRRNYRLKIFNYLGNLIEEHITTNQLNILEYYSNSYEYCIGFWEQAGTGTSTRWAKFCNTYTGECNEFFWYIGSYDDLVICGKRDRLIIQDIFDPDKYYREIEYSSLEYPVSDLEAPVWADFIDFGRKIAVTYYTDTHDRVTEIFDVNVN